MFATRECYTARPAYGSCPVKYPTYCGVATRLSSELPSPLIYVPCWGYEKLSEALGREIVA